MGFGAAVSEHPLATHAVGEVVGQVLEQVGPAPDVAVVFATGGFAGAMEDIASTVRATLAPSTLVGATAVSVLAGGHEVEDRAAVALFAADWGGRLRTGARGARAVRFDAQRDGEGWRLLGSDDVAVPGATLLLLADPFTFPIDGFLHRLHRQAPGVRVVGGMASAARGAGGNRLVADQTVTDRGAVGLFFPPGVPVHPLLAQGCRPLGEALVVTASRGNLVEEIAGRPAFDTGFFVDPTVFADVTNDMTIAREEIFGPVLSVIAYDGVDDAVAIANDSPYGLSGSVWGADGAAAADIARRMDTGTVTINHFGMAFGAPFGGYKDSGLGRELGPEGVDAYLQKKSISLDPAAG